MLFDVEIQINTFLSSKIKLNKFKFSGKIESNLIPKIVIIITVVITKIYNIPSYENNEN